jgi:hypothetical protein
VRVPPHPSAARQARRGAASHREFEAKFEAKRVFMLAF